MVAERLSLIARLAKHLSRAVNEGTRQRARLHLLDWLACVAGARHSAAARVGAGAWPALDRAALLGNVLEMDDVHRTALLHPGPVVWPAALARADGGLDRCLDAAVRGYEAMIAIGATMDARHYAHWHPTATMGGFGAAAAAASLIGLGEVQTGWALANAGSVAGGLWHMRHDDVLTKQWHIRHALRSGTDAARCAEAGLSGPCALLEGPQGLYAAMVDQPQPLLLAAGWQIGAVSFKPWAACRHAHAVIDAALTLRDARQLKPPFLVETYGDAIRFCDRPDPVTELDAKFSLQHAVAVVADGRGAAPPDFTPQAIAALAALRGAVTLREDPAFTARYPAHFGARVNGLELVDTRGDPERPLSEAGIMAKLRMLVAWGGLADAEADRAAHAALHGDDAGAIIRLLDDWLR